MKNAVNKATKNPFKCLELHIWNTAQLLLQPLGKGHMQQQQAAAEGRKTLSSAGAWRAR